MKGSLADRARRAQKARRNRLSKTHGGQAPTSLDASIHSTTSMPDIRATKSKQEDVVVRPVTPRADGYYSSSDVGLLRATTPTPTMMARMQEDVVARPVTPREGRVYRHYENDNFNINSKEDDISEMPMDEYQHDARIQKEELPNISDVSVLSSSMLSSSIETHQPYPTTTASLPKHQRRQQRMRYANNNPRRSPTNSNNDVPPVINGIEFDPELVFADNRTAVVSPTAETSNVDAADRGGGHHFNAQPAHQQQEQQQYSLERLTNAIQNGTKPSSLSPQELSLWNAIQQTMTTQRTESTMKRRMVERKLQETNHSLQTHDDQITYLQETNQQLELQLHQTRENQFKAKEGLRRAEALAAEKSKEANIKLKEFADRKRHLEATHQTQQEEHDAAIRAMQRVLADMATQKEQLEQRLADEDNGELLETLKRERDEAIAKSKRDEAQSKKDRDELRAKTEATMKERDDLLQKSKINEEKLRNQLEDVQKQLAENTKTKSATEKQLEDAKTELAETETKEKQKATAEKKLKTQLEEAIKQLAETRKELEAKTKQKTTAEQKLRTQLTDAKKRLAEAETKAKKKTAAEEELRVGLEKALADKEKEIQIKETSIAASKSTIEALSQPAERKDKSLPAIEDNSLQEKLKEKDEIIVSLKEETCKHQGKIEGLQKQLGKLVAASEAESSESKATIENLQNELNEVTDDNKTESAENQKTIESLRKDLSILKDYSKAQEIESKRAVESLQKELNTAKADKRAQSAESNRKIGALSMELNKVKADKNSNSTMTTRQLQKQRGLVKSLEKAVIDLEKSTKVANNDDTIRSSLLTLRVGLAALEQPDNGDDDVGTDVSFRTETSVGGLDPHELERHLDSIIRSDREVASQELRQELESKTTSIEVLEETLKKQKHEIELMKKHNQLLLKAKERSEAQFADEIRMMQEKHENNLRALSKKQQELQVLRASLKVENELGYISGDDSDDEEAKAEDVRAITHLSFGSNGNIEMTTRPTASEVENLKQRVQRLEEEKNRVDKDFQEEKESLLNAKMIISSLEKANKTMLEDMRARLSDSNTAIQSLIDKSMENEKMSKELQAELERVRKEKDEEAKKHQESLLKLKEQEEGLGGLTLVEESSSEDDDDDDEEEEAENE